MDNALAKRASFHEDGDEATSRPDDQRAFSDIRTTVSSESKRAQIAGLRLINKAGKFLDNAALARERTGTCAVRHLFGSCPAG